MRLGDLIGSEVRDGRDRRIGIVVDVRVTHEPAPQGEPPRPYLVTGLVAAPRRLRKLGRPDQLGPWAFRLIDRRAEGRRRFIGWDRIEDARPGLVRVRLSDP